MLISSSLVVILHTNLSYEFERLSVMSLKSIITSRKSIRSFTDKPVPDDIIEEIFSVAQSSPSNCNVQPWHSYVVSGDKKEKLKNVFLAELMAGKKPNPDFNWSVSYQDEHRKRQIGAAVSLYGALGIGREDKQERQMAMVRNWQFFGAPHVVFFTMRKYLDIMGAVDIGIYAQTLALLMQEKGIGSCMQGALGQYPDPARKLLDIPEERGILFGMSFGYADEKAPENKIEVGREALGDAVQFHK